MTPKQMELARRHAFAVFRLRPVPFRTFEMLQSENLNSKSDELDSNVRVHASSLAEFEASADLRAFRQWAVGTTDEDFIQGLEELPSASKAA